MSLSYFRASYEHASRGVFVKVLSICTEDASRITLKDEPRFEHKCILLIFLKGLFI